jgi:hydroxymethylglutaryl-CoA lyase
MVLAGFTELEVGAFVNPNKVPTMADSAEVVRGLTEVPARLHSLVFNLRGAERAVECGAEHVRLVVSASDGHSRANAGVSTEPALQRVEVAARWLRERGVGIEATIATAFTCPFDGDTPVGRVVSIAQRLSAMGVEVLHLADTIGSATPGDIRRVVHAVTADVPPVPLGLHLHNTYDMASANAWEGLSLGIRRFDAAVGGLGGCPFAPGAAGNIAADDLVNMFHREGIHTGVDPDKLSRARELLEKAVHHSLNSALARIGASPSAVRTTFA